MNAMNQQWKAKAVALLSALCCLVVLAYQAARAAEPEGFPLRTEYPKVPFWTTEQLAAKYHDVVIVDVRSKLEFDVVHMTRASQVPVARMGFESALEQLRPKDSPKEIVFYCNGHTCAKSYQAATKAMEAGFTNVYVYDAGIFDWTHAHPDLAVLMGTTPVDVSKLISDNQFNSHVVSLDEFRKKAAAQGAFIVDIREPFQMTATGGQQHTPARLKDLDVARHPSDKLLQFVLQPGRHKDSTMMIFDAVGHQVRWVQYFLEHYGYKNYYFLEKGAAAAGEG